MSEERATYRAGRFSIAALAPSGWLLDWRGGDGVVLSSHYAGPADLRDLITVCEQALGERRYSAEEVLPAMREMYDAGWARLDIKLVRAAILARLDAAGGTG